MAITQLGRQVIHQKASGTHSGLTQADANEGVLVRYNAGNTAWQNGQPQYVKTNAVNQRAAGVVQNVAGANITSSTEPSLDPRGTAPGGSVVTVATQGFVLLKFDTALTATSSGQRVWPSTTAGLAATHASTIPAGAVFLGTIVAADDNTNNVGLVALNLPD